MNDGVWKIKVLSWLAGVMLMVGDAGAGLPVSQDNCGLDVAYATLSMFGQAKSLTALASDLGLDSERKRSASLWDLSQIFAKAGLTSQGFKAPDANALLASVPRNSVAIVRCQTSSNGGSLAHFFLLIPSGPTVTLFDPYRRRSRALVPQDVPSDPWLLNMTGEFLVISETAEMGSGLRWMDSSIKLGEQSIKQESIVTRVRFRNTSKFPVELSEPHGSCGCMKKIDWPRGPIGPGEMGEIVVQIDPSALTVGEQLKQIMVGQRGDERHAAVIPISLTLVRPPEPRTCELSMAELEYGRRSTSSIAAEVTTILVTIPNGGQIDRPKALITVEAPSGLRAVLQNDESSSEDAGPDRRLVYTIEWTLPPAIGEFRHTVVWTVTQAGKAPSKLSLPITGEAYMAEKVR